MADITLSRPAAQTRQAVSSGADDRFVFDFPTGDATLSRDGDSLIMTFDDGGALELTDFYTTYNKDNVPDFVVDGAEVSGADFFTAMNEPDLMPAAGPAAQQDQGSRHDADWADSALYGGIDRLGGLDLGFDDARVEYVRDGGAGGDGAGVPDISDPVTPPEIIPPHDPGVPEIPTNITVVPNNVPDPDGSHNIVIGQGPTALGGADAPDHVRLAFMLDASGNGSVTQFVGDGSGGSLFRGLIEAQSEKPKTDVAGASKDGLLYYHNQTGRWTPVEGGSSFEYGGKTFTVNNDGSFSYENDAGEEVRCFISHYDNPAIYEYPLLYNSLDRIGNYITDAYDDIRPGQTLDVLLEGFDIKVESYATVTITCDENGEKSIQYNACVSSGYKVSKDENGDYVVSKDYTGTTTSGAKGEHTAWDSGTGQFVSDYVGTVEDAAAFIRHILADFNAKVVYNIHSSWGYQGNYNYTATNYDNALELANGWFASFGEDGGVNQGFLISDGGASASLHELGSTTGVKIGWGEGVAWQDGAAVDFSKVARYSLNGGETWSDAHDWQDITAGGWKPGTAGAIVELEGGAVLVINELGLVYGIKDGTTATQLKMGRDGCNVPIVMGFVDGHYAPCAITGSQDNDSPDEGSYNAAEEAAKALLDLPNTTLTTVLVGGKADSEFEQLASPGHNTKIEAWSYIKQELGGLIVESKTAGEDSIDGGAGNDILFGDRLAEAADGGDATEANVAVLKKLAGYGSSDSPSEADIAEGLRDKAEDIADGIDKSGLSGGNDRLFGGAGDDVLFGMAGDDLLAGDGSQAAFADINVTGIHNMSPDSLVDLEGELAGRESDTDGSDLLFGGKGDDVLIGGGGDDFLSGGEGRDVLLGGSGDDILVGGQDAATAQNYNLAFLVDTSNPDNLGDVCAQLKAAINGMKENMGEDCAINVMLMGFNSYATELVSVDSDNEDFFKNIEDAITNLEKPVSETFRDTSFVETPHNAQNNDNGANYELAFNYASKWFASRAAAEGTVNKTFVLVGQAPVGQISNDFPSDLSVTGTMAGTLLIPNSSVDGVLCTDPSYGVTGYNSELGKIILDGFVFGEEYQVRAENSKGESHVLFTIGTNGMAYFKNVDNDSAYNKDGYNFFWNREGKPPRHRAEGQMAGMEAPDGKGGDEYPLLAMWDQQLQCWTLGYVSAMSSSSTSEAEAISGYNQLHENCGDVTFIDFGTGSINFAGFVDSNAMDVTKLGDSVPNLFTQPGDTLLGGDGNDILFGDDVPAELAGMDAAAIQEVVRESPEDFANIADGDEGDNDILYGGAGNDILYGGAGNDELHGGEGDDMLFGGSGDDKLYGDAGDDYLDGGAGRDYLYGGEGDDFIVYDPTDYLIDGGDGIDFLLSSGKYGDKEYSLADMLGNWSDREHDDMPMVNAVEVKLTGVASLQNMSELAEQYGFEVKHDGGRDILALSSNWRLETGSDADTGADAAVDSKTHTYRFHDENGDKTEVTLETTLVDITSESAAEGEQAARIILALANG